MSGWACLAARLGLHSRSKSGCGACHACGAALALKHASIVHLLGLLAACPYLAYFWVIMTPTTLLS